MAVEENVEEYDDSLYDLSDEELEAAMQEARAQQASPDTEIEEETEGEAEEELEQPEEEVDDQDGTDTEDEDSEDNEDESDDEDEVEDETDEDSEEVESTDEADEEQPDEDGTDAKDEEHEEEPKVETYKVKANGTEFDFTVDELKLLASKGMNYTKRIQTIKPYEKKISILEEANISEDDLNLMVDVLKGDKNALASVAKRTGIDLMEVDTEDVKYQPKTYGKSEAELAIDNVVSNISQDKEYAITHHVIENQWDDASKRMFVDRPELINELHIDVVNGTFDKVSPAAMKLKVLDGGTKSDIEYYVMAGQQLNAQRLADEAKAVKAKEEEKVQQDKVKEVKQVAKKRVATTKASKKRKAAATTKTNAGNTITDYLNESDEAFEQWEKEYHKKYG
jgi:hypothetical protein